jgi:hypothetical protein
VRTVTSSFRSAINNPAGIKQPWVLGISGRIARLTIRFCADVTGGPQTTKTRKLSPPGLRCAPLCTKAQEVLACPRCFLGVTLRPSASTANLCQVSVEISPTSTPGKRIRVLERPHKHECDAFSPCFRDDPLTWTFGLLQMADAFFRGLSRLLVSESRWL